MHTTFLSDLYWLGHSHTALTENSEWTIYPDNSGRIVKKPKRSVITAGYNDGFIQRDLKGDATYRNSFVEERFIIPTGLGSAILHINVPRAHDANEVYAEIIN